MADVLNMYFLRPAVGGPVEGPTFPHLRRVRAGDRRAHPVLTGDAGPAAL